MKAVLAEAEGLQGDRLVIPQPIMELTTRCSDSSLGWRVLALLAAAPAALQGLASSGTSVCGIHMCVCCSDTAAPELNALSGTCISLPDRATQD